MSDVETAQATADEAWAAHEEARSPLRDELRELLRSVEGVTGLQPGPGADNLVDRFLDFAEFHAETLTTAANSRANALDAQALRDEAIAAQPEAEKPPEPSSLETSDHEQIRSWLRDASDNDVRAALDALLDADAQRAWAVQLMEWARADGTTAQVLTAIQEKITVKSDPTPDVSGDAVAQVGGSSTYSDSAAVADALATVNAEGEPASDAGAEEIAAWVGDDVGRARVKYDQENEREGGARPDVLAALVAILDTGADVPPTE